MGVVTETRWVNYPDANGDGAVTATDASIALSFSAACGTGSYTNDKDNCEKYLNDKNNGGGKS